MVDAAKAAPPGDQLPAARQWKDEALRLCDRYLREVVVAFDLCPWAEPSVRAGRVARDVCLSVLPQPEECLPFRRDLLARTAPPADIGLLIFPRFSGGWSAFDTFAERVRRVAAGPEFLVAAFHPDGLASFTGPHQLVSFLRRTPDATLQFVRAAVIDGLKQHQPGISDAVGLRNHDTVVGGGARDRLEDAVRSIQADRAASHLRLTAQPGSVTQADG